MECYKCGCGVTNSDSHIHFGEQYSGRTAGHWLMRGWVKSYSSGRGGKGASLGYSTEKNRFRQTRMRLCNACYLPILREIRRQQILDERMDIFKGFLSLIFVSWLVWLIWIREPSPDVKITKEPIVVSQEKKEPIKIETFPKKDELDYLVEAIIEREEIIVSAPIKKEEILKEFEEPVQKNQFFDQRDINTLKELFTF